MKKFIIIIGLVCVGTSQSSYELLNQCINRCLDKAPEGTVCETACPAILDCLQKCDNEGKDDCGAACNATGWTDYKAG